MGVLPWYPLTAAIVSFFWTGEKINRDGFISTQQKKRHSGRVFFALLLRVPVKRAKEMCEIDLVGSESTEKPLSAEYKKMVEKLYKPPSA